MRLQPADSPNSTSFSGCIAQHFFTANHTLQFVWVVNANINSLCDMATVFHTPSGFACTQQSLTDCLLAYTLPLVFCHFCTESQFGVCAELLLALNALTCCNSIGRVSVSPAAGFSVLHLDSQSIGETSSLTVACNAFAADIRLNKNICELLNDNPTQRDMVGLPIKYCSNRREAFCAYDVPPKVACCTVKPQLAEHLLLATLPLLS